MAWHRPSPSLWNRELQRSKPPSRASPSGSKPRQQNGRFDLWPISSRPRASLSIAIWPASTLPVASRSEEHTSELQSLMSITYAALCLTNKTHDTPTFQLCRYYMTLHAHQPITIHTQYNYPHAHSTQLPQLK